MNLRSALRWTAMYRAVTWASGVVFLLFLGAAFVLGLDDVITTAVFGNPYRLADVGFSGPPLVLALVGFLVWQFTTTVAFYKTLTEATDEQMVQRFDSEKVKSEILEVLDDRLAEMQTELERTRKQAGGGSGPTAGATTGPGDAESSGSFDFEG